MNVHVLNGDALQSQLPATITPYIVMRECMIEGPHDIEDISIFWKNRCEYFVETFKTTKERYEELVVTELDKLSMIDAGSEFCLWFEYDLFCQTNMWYVISLLHNQFENLKISWVQPDHRKWTGFGEMSPERLENAYNNRANLSSLDIDIFDSIWHHYVQRDMQFFKLQNLEKETNLNQIVGSIEALIKLYPDKGEDRPSKLLRAIIAENPAADFGKVFSLFSQQAGVYGYGDLQVKKLIDKIQLS